VRGHPSIQRSGYLKISIQKLERGFRRFIFGAYIYAEIIQKLERVRGRLMAHGTGASGKQIRKDKKGVASVERQRP
jgi:hypothetical protein